MSDSGVNLKDVRTDVQRMAEVTAEIVAAETPEQVLHRTFDRLNEVIPSSLWLAIWSGSGGNGAIVCTASSMAEGEAQQLVVNAIGRTEPEFRSKFVTPRFVRTYRRSTPDGAEEPSGVPTWVDFAVQICDMTVLLSGFSDAPHDVRQQVWPYVSTLVNCAVPCLINAHVAAKRQRRSVRQAAGDEATLNDALSRRIAEANSHGAELAFMLIGVSCPNGSKERKPASRDTVTAISHLVLTTVRESDEVFYASEDKLGLIMPYTDPRSALIAADRIFARLANEQSAGNLSSARLTMGVSGLDAGVNSGEDLRSRAGSALEEARKAACGAFLYV